MLKIPVLLFVAAFSHFAPPEISAQSTTVQHFEDARIDEINKDSDPIPVTVTKCCTKDQVKWIAQGAMKDKVKALSKGDCITVDTDDKGVLQSVTTKSIAVSASTRWGVLAAAFALCFFVASLLTWWNPRKLIIGIDGRYSKSQLQMTLWFFVVIASYLATLYLRVHKAGWDFLGGINIPQNLFLISGMSALTFGGARAITSSKADQAKAQGNPVAKSPGQPSLWNLICNDNHIFDFGDFQMVVITLLAIGTYLALIFNFLGSIELLKTVDLPNVDTTILAAFGLGQGAYLTKKAAGTVGSA